MLVKVSAALAAPDTCGLKVTVNDVLRPAAIVTGSERPPTLKIELFELAAVTVTFAPLAVSVPVAVPLDPTVTLPRFKVVGVTESWPAPATLVPDSGMVSVGFVAVDVIVILPLIDPEEVGAKDTVKLALCPPFRVMGAVIPVRLNPVPLLATWETVMLAPPLLVIVSEIDWVFPTVTLPKFRLDGFEVSAPFAATPVPDNAMVRVGLGPFELMVTVDCTAPAVCGAKVTVNVVLAEAFSVRGAATPLS